MSEPPFVLSEDARFESATNVEGFPMSGVRVGVLVRTATALMLEVRLEKGSKVPEHAHAHESLCYVLEGEAEVVIGSTTVRVKAGDAFAHPIGVPHSAKAIRDTRWVEVKTPPEITW